MNSHDKYLPQSCEFIWQRALDCIHKYWKFSCVMDNCQKSVTFTLKLRNVYFMLDNHWKITSQIYDLHTGSNGSSHVYVILVCEDFS